jgi:hypothetical protein
MDGGQARYNWKVPLSGYAPQYAYENGSLDARIPFEELRKLSYITPTPGPSVMIRSFRARSARVYRDRN